MKSKKNFVSHSKVNNLRTRTLQGGSRILVDIKLGLTEKPNGMKQSRDSFSLALVKRNAIDGSLS